MSASLGVLGAGSILPREGYGAAGYALRPAPGEPVTLLDCGPGSVRMLAAVAVGVEEVERVVISHFHTDHCLDLFALLFARRNPALSAVGRLELVGPRGLRELVERGAAALRGHPRPVDVVFREVEPGESLRVGEGRLALTSCPTGHTAEALAWRVDVGGGRSVTYTGDTGEVEAVAELARGTSLFVAECSFADEDAVASHLTPSAAGRLAERAGCERLLLTHFYPSLAPDAAREAAARVYAGPIEVARDGAVYEV